MMRRYIISLILFISWIPSQGQSQFSLTQAIDYALTHHNSLRVSELDEENARWQYKEALSIGMPNIKGNMDYTYYYQRPVQPTEDFLSPAVYGILFSEEVIQPRELGPPETF